MTKAGWAWQQNPTSRKRREKWGTPGRGDPDRKANVKGIGQGARSTQAIFA
jgi:hypothetical protein